MTTTTDTLHAEIAARKARALAIACPFCGTSAGQPCRTRNSSREQEWPHSRRVALSTPVDERYRPTQVEALCCACGHCRRVSVDYHRHSDPNHADGDKGKQGGWRRTQTLKCDACGSSTRHAILAKDDAEAYWDERRQHAALGDDHVLSWDTEYLLKWRQEYRQMPFPRNPYLTHRRYTADAQRAWDDGTKTVTALCGEQIEVTCDPREREKYSTTHRRNEDGYLIAEVVSEIEITDLETGLSWIDMDCVDCCRASNAVQAANRRRYLEELLAYYARRPERVDDNEVDCLIAVFTKLAETMRNRKG